MDPKLYYRWCALMKRIVGAIKSETEHSMPSHMDEEEAVKLFHIGMEKVVTKESRHSKRGTQRKMYTVLRLIQEGEASRNPNVKRASVDEL